METTSANDIIARLSAWLIGEARHAPDAATLDQAIVDALCDAGIPLARLTTGVPSLHPDVDSFSTLWERGKGMTFRRFRVADAAAANLTASPLYTAYRTGHTSRIRLEGDARPGEYSLMGELRAAGLSDYLVVALPFADKSNKAMSFATDRPGGFSNDEIAVLEGIRHALAAAQEVQYLRHLARTLMDTYVGPIAGQRVLQGAIKRGTGESIRAAIWFSDLKGFTAFSDTLPRDAVIALLNDYFDILTNAVASEGGEVLKFIGDAVLAIFQPDEDGDQAAAHRALRAAQAIHTALAAYNEADAGRDKPALECGVALHFGDVHYGNVGGQHRLDFTVIGPAVNLTSRIEGLTRPLDAPILVSDVFAELHGGDFRSAGTHDFKGISRRQEVFAPASFPR